jgi:hypothetical protein
MAEYLPVTTSGTSYINTDRNMGASQKDAESFEVPQ